MNAASATRDERTLLLSVQNPASSQCDFLLGRCVSAEPAAVFAGLVLFGFRNTLLAALPAPLPVTSPLGLHFAGRAILPRVDFESQG
jgi:hypothetical protein